MQPQQPQTSTTTTPEPPVETLPAPVPPAPLAAAPAPAGPPAPRVTLDQLMQLPESDHKKQWIDALVQAETARMIYAQDRQYAIDVYSSGQFDDMKKLNPQQGVAYAIVKQQIGRDWGLTRADSIRSVYMVGGRPALENELVASRCFDAGIAWDMEEHTETIQYKNKPWQKCVGVTLWIRIWNAEKKKWEPKLDRKGEQVSVSFTEADADHAEIWEGGKKIKLSEKWNFQSWGRDMYYWKCVARVKRFHAPNVLRGGVPQSDAQDLPPVEGPLALPAGPSEPEVLQPEPEKPKHTNMRDRIREQDQALDAQEAAEQAPKTS
jgi:hypothetical protein